MITNPANTTATDICTQAIRECGACGVGQTPLAQDITEAQARLQWMLQEWERKRWLIWHLVNLVVTSTGAQSYTVGPGGDFNTGSPSGAYPTSVRPARVESAFLRQLTQSQPNQIDYPLEILKSREDYDRISLKQLQSFPSYLWYDSDWPLGRVYPWPVAQASIYALGLSIVEQLPPAFATSSAVFNIPYEYYNAMVTNLAMRLRPKYGIVAMPGDSLPGIAKDALAAIRSVNVQIASLVVPGDLIRPQIYNVFSDRSY